MMTTDVFAGYVEELPPLRAERLLDAAHAAHPTPTWFDAQVTALKRSENGSEAEAPNEPRPFRLKLSDPQGTGSFHGWISPRSLHARVLQLQDGGYG